MRIDCSKISEPASEVVAERKIESEQIGLDDGAQHYLCFAFARAGGQPPDAAFFHAPVHFMARHQQAGQPADPGLMTDHHGVFVALRPVDRGKYRAHVGAWREVVEYFSVPRQSRCRFARAQRGAANHAIVGGQVPAQPRCGGGLAAALGAHEGGDRDGAPRRAHAARV